MKCFIALGIFVRVVVNLRLHLNIQLVLMKNQPSNDAIPYVLPQKTKTDIKFLSKSFSCSNMMESKNNFLHCTSCPLALCPSHQQKPRLIYQNKTSYLPLLIHRPNKNGYFKCYHCFGINLNGEKNSTKSLLINFNLTLHILWSRIINGHNNFVQITLTNCK